MVARGEASYDLAVDMDGALLTTDTLHEGVVTALLRRPWRLLRALSQLPKGRAAVKAALVDDSMDGVHAYPVRRDFLAYLRAEREGGRRLHLVSAADHRVASAVAARIGLFDSVIASRDEVNLKGPAKAEHLVRTFPAGFSYAGDSAADLAVFPKAQTIVLAGAKPHITARAQQLGVPIEATFPAEPLRLKPLMRALRLHQWAKNLLVFVPLLLSGSLIEALPVLRCVAGFLLMGLVASGTYIINDLSDLAADRVHPTKAARPFAAGQIPVLGGVAGAVLLISLGLAGAWALSPKFFGLLCVYCVGTLSYTLALKRTPLADVSVLAGLYALRVGMGAALSFAPLSDWLLVFSLFFFLSLSLAKRHVELVRLHQRGVQEVAGRGYRASDMVLTLPLGVASAMTSLLVMVMFLVFEAFPPHNYPNPGFLWAAPGVVFLWLCRIWLLASRGELHDDPVSFAVKDQTSLGLGLLLVGCTLAAVLTTA